MNERRPTAAAGERWRKWGAEAPLPTDTDPRVPDHWLDPVVDEQVEAAFDEGWTSGFGAGVAVRPWLVLILVGACLAVGFWFAAAVVHAAPREEQLPSIPVADAASLGVPPDSGVAQRQSTAPLRVRAAEVPGSNPGSGANGGTPSPTPSSRSASGASSLQGVQGIATWYCCTRRHPSGLYAAAGPALRVGHWRGRVVRVCSPGGCVDVTLIDWCACGHGRVIDLYPAAFRRLAPLSQGIVGVTVSWGGSPRPPATDVGP